MGFKESARAIGLAALMTMGTGAEAEKPKGKIRQEAKVKQRELAEEDFRQFESKVKSIVEIAKQHKLDTKLQRLIDLREKSTLTEAEKEEFSALNQYTLDKRKYLQKLVHDVDQILVDAFKFQKQLKGRKALQDDLLYVNKLHHLFEDDPPFDD